MSDLVGWPDPGPCNPVDAKIRGQLPIAAQQHGQVPRTIHHHHHEGVRVPALHLFVDVKVHFQVPARLLGDLDVRDILLLLDR
jgi:hypothetical protein